MARGQVLLEGIRKSFASADVIKGVDLAIEPGEFVVFVGPSGCGKSTMLRTISGLESPTSGRIVIGGRDVTREHPARRGIAMVFQSYALYPHMSVAENMGFALRIAGLPKAQIRDKVEHAARVLQLEHLLERKPRELSGGQRQRVAIGRAIVREPEVFLFDEPLSNLDAALRGQMRVELARLHGRLGATMIYVTHDQVEAMTLASRIVVFNAGRIEQVGTPMELYEQPANLFVAGFIGSPRMNLLDGAVLGVSARGVDVEVPGGRLLLPPRAAGVVEPGQSIRLGIRPEHLQRVPDGETHEGFWGRLELTERLGGETLAHVRLTGSQGDPLIAKFPGDVIIGRGATVRLRVDAAHCHLFGDDGRAIPAAAAVVAESHGQH